MGRDQFADQAQAGRREDGLGLIELVTEVDERHIDGAIGLMV